MPPAERTRFAITFRRLRWQLHWAVHSSSDVLPDRAWWEGMTLLLPKTGSARVVYSRRFPSSAIASWISQTVAPGATVVDVGAHAGVYTLLASRLATDTGTVHALEPQSDLLSLILRSAALNGLDNVKGHRLVLDESNGTVSLAIDPRTRGAFTVGPSAVEGMKVDSTTLHSFARAENLSEIALVKLDAAGNEAAVLRGAGPLLERRAVGAIVCKLYHADVIAERFPGAEGPSAIVELLRDHRYEVVLPDGTAADRGHLENIFARGAYSVPALATSE